MILTSWNCRGLANKPKKLALKEWVLNSKADVIFLQETLGKASEIESMLKTLLPGWIFSAIDSSGHSGGIAIGTKEGRVKVINHWGMKQVMGMEVSSPDFSFPINIVNIYGPCQDREFFWAELMSKSVLKSSLLIMGGDFNFSMGRAEAWGPSAREDPLTAFFFNLLTENNLIDTSPIKLKPTWRNRRSGEDRIAKRLDRFLLSESLAAKAPLLK